MYAIFAYRHAGNAPWFAVAPRAVVFEGNPFLTHLVLTALAIMTPMVFLQSARDVLFVDLIIVPFLTIIAHTGSRAPEHAALAMMVWLSVLLLTSASTFVVLVNRGRLIQAQREAAEARDEALEAVRVRSAFLANMSHEIRTPMNGVLGILELLESAQLGDDQARQFATARQSGEDLLAIINEILDFARIDADHLARARHRRRRPRRTRPLSPSPRRCVMMLCSPLATIMPARLP